MQPYFCQCCSDCCFDARSYMLVTVQVLPRCVRTDAINYLQTSSLGKACATSTQLPWLLLHIGGGESIAVGPQLPRHPSAPLQPAGPMGNPMGNAMGEQADSTTFQPAGLTDPHNSVGSGALIGQLPTVSTAPSQATSQAASPASSPAVLPASSEDVQASSFIATVKQSYLC